MKDRQDSTTSLSSLLVWEEYKAEKLISVVRLFLIGIALILHGIELWLLGMEDLSGLWPYGAAFIAALLLYTEVKLWGQDRFKKYYGGWVKYLYILIDTAVLSFLVIETVKPSNFPAGVSGPVLAPLLSLAAGLILVSLSILRFSPAGCLFSGAAWMAASVFMLEHSKQYESPVATGETLFMAYFFVFCITLTLTFLCAFIARQFRSIVTKSKKQEQLERFLPEAVAREIMQGDRVLTTGGKKQKVTILFSDIRGFTGISERESPEEVVDFLNSYLNDMIDIIFRYRGTLDKIMGDGIMALYGAPVALEDAPAAAVRTAVDMQEKLKDFNAIRRLKNKEPIEIGIGIHTGDVILGNIGSQKRIEFTAIGDTVNTAARLEGFSKTSQANIIISAATRAHLNGDFEYRRLGEASLKGKQNKIEVFEVVT